MMATSMTKQPPGWPLVIVIIVISRRHRSCRIGASGNVQQQFVFLILIHFLPMKLLLSRQRKKPGP